MKKLAVLLGFALIMIAQGASAQTLKAVKDRGMLNCGANGMLAGFGIPDAQGKWTGLDVDVCRAIAAAVLGDATKVKFVPLTAKDRFTALQSGEVDVLMDNTWATPLYFDAFAHGVDLSIQAGTKYIGGHSDIMFGCVAANAKTYPSLKTVVTTMGLCVGPDDMFLALRGLRTMGVRLQRHMESGLRVARWLEQRPEVLHVLHPALESNPGHAIWKRDFSGACGLFSIALKPTSEKSVYAFMDELSLFGMGFSWGGFESLVVLFDCGEYRTATKWSPGGPTLRFPVGLEDPGDLIADLERGFAAMNAAKT